MKERHVTSRSSMPDLAEFGTGKLAYIRRMRGDEVPRTFPQAPILPANGSYFALFSAEGTPMMLTDCRDAALANARSNELEAVFVH